MPLYDYKCHACGSVFEVKQRINDQPLTVHENCGGALERLISPPALQFKGSGWYVTDYARSGKDGKASSKDGGESTAKDTGKTETSAKKESPAKKADG
jgi:putative FmdB family regulatory protein